MCVFCVHAQGGGGRSLIPGSVGPLTLRMLKWSSLIRPEISSAINIKPSELLGQRCKANILSRSLSVKIMILLTHLRSSSLEISREKRQLEFSCLFNQLFNKLVTYSCWPINERAFRGWECMLSVTASMRCSPHTVYFRKGKVSTKALVCGCVLLWMPAWIWPLCTPYH